MENTPKGIDRRAIAGILLIVAGGLLLLDQLDLLSFNLRYYLISWKTLLIGIGIITISNRSNRTTGAILIGLGLLFWMPELLDYRVRFSTIFWPAILIGIGFVILTRRDKGENNGNHHIFSGSKYPNEHPGDYIDELAIFGGGNTRITSDNFKGGKITAIFGGSDIEMKSAIPSPEGCVIDTFVLFGGSNLVVPEDWKVKSEVVSILGGYSDKRMMTLDYDPQKTLILKGIVLFGGLELKSY